MTASIGYPPSGLPSGSSESAGNSVVGQNRLAVGAPSPGGSLAAPSAPNTPVISADLQGNAIFVSLPSAVVNNGANVQQFRITRSDGKVFYSLSMPCSVPAVGGVPVTVTVAALNSVDWGPESAASNSVTPSASATVPGQPDAPTATAGDGTVSLAFAAPSTGGSPILEYGALLSNGNTNTGNPTGSPVSVASANGAPVTGQIRARNAIGWGPYSPASNSVTPQAAPVVSRIDVLQRFNLPNTNARRIRMSDITARDFVIVRNLESTNIMEIGFTTVGNNDANAPSSWTAVNPGQEWYETGSTNQIFVRAQTAGAPVICELETTITL